MRFHILACTLNYPPKIYCNKKIAEPKTGLEPVSVCFEFESGAFECGVKPVIDGRGRYRSRHGLVVDRNWLRRNGIVCRCVPSLELGNLDWLLAQGSQISNAWAEIDLIGIERKSLPKTKKVIPDVPNLCNAVPVLLLLESERERFQNRLR